VCVLTQSESVLLLEMADLPSYDL